MKLKRVQNYSNRQALVKICFIAIVLLFIFRAFTISNIEANDSALKVMASNKSEKIFNEKAIRGNILDREGKILAINLIHKRINLDPMIIQDEYLEALAEALIVPVDELRKTIDSKRANNRKYFIVKKNLKVTDPILKNIARLKQKKQWLDVCEIKFVKPSNTLMDKAKLLINIKSVSYTHLRAHET